MGNFYMKSEFQIEWFKNIEEVEEFHDDYFGGEMISLSLADLRHLADGNFLAGM